jgi:hypothetical protein
LLYSILLRSALLRVIFRILYCRSTPSFRSQQVSAEDKKKRKYLDVWDADSYAALHDQWKRIYFR